ncbi:MAG: Crp/Fnr family transcriptional regulator [Thermoanaerobaculia bacterium]|nr:Crp/Fnr family transcriptional regulator [Thermoanaerobaculia bacterium]
MAESLEKLLGEIPMFQRLGAEDRRSLAAVSSLVEFERGAEIFAEGDPPRWLFVALSGHVKIAKLTPAGREVILEIFGPGDPLGAVAVYEGRAFPATARALEPVRCVRTPRDTFFRLLAERPTLLAGLLGGLTLRLMELTDRLVELTGARVEERLARLLLKQAAELGRPERGGTFMPLHLSRQELADLAGTTLETAIRIMSRWGKRRLVMTETDGFLLVDVPALEALASGAERD